MVKKDGEEPEGTFQSRANQDAFLAAFGTSGSVRSAAESVGIKRSTVDQWKSRNTHRFREKFRIAKEIFREYLQDIAVERIRDQASNANPVLLITLLNAHYPELYRHDGRTATNDVKDMMVEWKKFVKNTARKSREEDRTEEDRREEEKRSAVDAVEALMARKKEPKKE
jgi:hypothetical protein|tara:strand:+ start:798 stop:1304 length:507 start_codon:yes stop_codon:yes gene_type:complete